MASEGNTGNVQEAFLDSVRTVIIVDDEFPTYGSLASDLDATSAAPAIAIRKVSTPANVAAEPTVAGDAATDPIGPSGDATEPTGDDDITPGGVSGRIHDVSRAAALWGAFRRGVGTVTLTMAEIWSREIPASVKLISLFSTTSWMSMILHPH